MSQAKIDYIYKRLKNSERKQAIFKIKTRLVIKAVITGLIVGIFLKIFLGFVDALTFIIGLMNEQTIILYVSIFLTGFAFFLIMTIPYVPTWIFTKKDIEDYNNARNTKPSK